MQWWDNVVFPIRRIWKRVAIRLGIRNSGLLKLRQDVRTCEYEDVHVLWELLQKNEVLAQSHEELAQSHRNKKKPYYNFIDRFS